MKINGMIRALDQLTKKRDFFEIVGQILGTLLEQPKRKTHIVFSCKLDSRAVTKYLAILQQADLIGNDPSTEYYQVTKRGFEFRQKYRELMEMINIDSKIRTGTESHSENILPPIVN